MRTNKEGQRVEKSMQFGGTFVELFKIAGFTLIYLLVAFLSFLTIQPPDGMAWFWPPSGLALAALVYNRRSHWPGFLTAVFIASLAANLFAGRSLPVSLGFSIAHFLESFIAAGLLTYLLPKIGARRTTFNFQRVINVLAFVGVVLVASALAALIAAFSMESDFLRVWLTWQVSSVLGTLLIFPLLVCWHPVVGAKRPGRLGKGHIIEGALLLGGLLAMFWLVFLQDHSILTASLLRTYLIFPFLIWAAMRFGQRFVTLSIFMTGLGATLATMNGLGQFAYQPTMGPYHMFALQLYLLLLIISTLNLSAAITEVKISSAAVSSSEAELRDLFQNASIGIFHSLPGAGFIKVNPALANMLGYDSPEDMEALVTNIGSQLYVEPVKYNSLLVNILQKEGWTHSINRYRRKDSSLMAGKLSVRRVTGNDGKLAYLEGFVEDVTERLAADEALKKSEAILNETQEIARLGGWEYDCADKKMTWTKEVYSIHGVGPEFDPNEISRVLEFYPGTDRSAMEQAFQRATIEGEPYDLELRFINAQGVHLWVRVRAAAIREGSQVVKVTGTIMDISERKAAQIALAANEEQLRLAMEASNDGMWDWRPRENVTYYSPAYYRQLGYTPEEFPADPQEWMSLLHPDDLPLFKKVNQGWLDGQMQSCEVEIRLWSKSNGWRWILSRGKVVTADKDNKPLRIIGTHVDITERKKVEEALRHANRKLEKQAVASEAMHALLIEQATHDALTGLYNRRFLDDALKREILRANREGSVVSVLMLDIDHFKNFNDLYGHEAGDQVLVALSSLLRVNIRESDIACRYGGEEFVVILPGAGSADARRRAELIREDFSNIRVGSGSISATISIGVAEYPQHATSADELLRSADLALYEAKNAGRNRVAIF